MIKTPKILPLLLGAAGLLGLAQSSPSTIASIQSLIRSRQYDDALSATETAIKHTPNDYHLWALEGIVYSLEQNPRKALEAFDHSLRISPGYLVALKGEGQLLYQQHDPRAEQVFTKILAADPQDTTAHELLALLEAKQGHCKQADQHFEAAAQPAGSHPASLGAWGTCLVHDGQVKQAVPVFQQLASLLPQSEDARYDLAVVLVETKKYAEGVEMLQPLLSVQPPDPDVLSLASEASEGAGDTPKAVALLRQAIVERPGTPDYYVSFAALCLNHDSFQVGIDMINAGLHRIPGESSLFIARGLLYAQLAQYDQAEADFRTAEHLNTAQSTSAEAIDLAEMQKNNPQAALAQVRSQLNQHPESALLHYLLARLLADQGGDTDPARAREVLTAASQAVQLQPNLMEARDLMATTYTRLGQYDRAIEQSRMALKMSPDDQTATYHLIVALRHAGAAQHREEIQTLVKRLSDLQLLSRQQETDRKRFKLVEEKQSANN